MCLQIQINRIFFLFSRRHTSLIYRHQVKLIFVIISNVEVGRQSTADFIRIAF